MIERGAALRLAASLVLAGLVSACARGEKAEMLTASVPVEAPKVIGPAVAASQEHQRIIDAYGGAYSDPRLEKFVGDIATRLAAASDRPDITYRVTILNSPSVNAFALPNGQLYVTRGLLALANDTSEFAAVIAHEMSHVVARHGVQRADQEKQAVLVSRVVSDVLSDPKAGELALAKSKIALASFSRSQELEADRLGVRTLAKAGYDPYGASRFLTALGNQSQLAPSASRDQNLDFLSSHPSTPERVSLAVSAARQFGAPGITKSDRDAYLAAIDGLVFGDDPVQGVARGRWFVHPTLGFKFMAPDGFVFDNGAEAVLGVSPDGRALRLDSVRLDASQSLEQYLASGWIEGAQIGEIEKLTINDLPAATVLAQGRDWTFRLVAVRLGPDVYRIIYAAKTLGAQVDQEFRKSFESFRRIDAAEARSIKPLRVRIATVQPGENVETLAKRMGGMDHALERFRILNELPPEGEVKAGDKVKIVGE